MTTLKRLRSGSASVCSGEAPKMTADDGVMLNYHHHMGTVVQSADDIDLLMEATTDEVQLLLDTGHAIYSVDSRRYRSAGLLIPVFFTCSKK